MPLIMTIETNNLSIKTTDEDSTLSTVIDIEMDTAVATSASDVDTNRSCIYSAGAKLLIIILMTNAEIMLIIFSIKTGNPMFALLGLLMLCLGGYSDDEA